MAGGMIQMINHGISTGALFLIVGFIYERRHTRQISEFGGLAKQMPVFATIFMIITFSSVGLPGTNGFVGEFLALMGAFESELRWYAVFATTGVIFAAVYMLWMFQRVMFGELKNPKNAELKDLSSREVVLMLPLLLFVFWIGVYPNTFFDKMNPAIEQLIQQVKGRQIQALQIVPAAEAAEPAPMLPAAGGNAPAEHGAAPAAEEASEAPVLPPGHPPIAPAHPGGH
jgi:NADH-quinone oxidoreductase subunit M